MSARRRHSRPNGRPRKLLETETRDTLLKSLRLGVPVAISCQGSGISESTFYGWMQRGYSENEERAAEDGEPDEGEEPYLILFREVQKARADAATRNVGLIQKAAQGGSVTEESTRKYRDPETGQLVTETTVKTSAPDWRAAGWYLERAHRGEFTKGAEQVEVTGAGGGPIQIAADAEALSRRLQEHLAAGVAAPLAIDAGSDEDTDDDSDET